MTDPKDTRDIAVTAKSLIDQHMQDCVRVREAIFASFKDFRNDLKRQNWILAMIVGGLILVSKLPDYIPFLSHGKVGQ